MSSTRPRRSLRHWQISGFDYCFRCGTALSRALRKSGINFSAELKTTPRDYHFSCKGCDDLVDGAA